MCLQMGEPTHRGDSVDLVGEAERGLMAAEAVVAVEQAGQFEAMNAGPKIVGRVFRLGGAHGRRPASVVGAVELMGRQRATLAADRSMDAVERFAKASSTVLPSALLGTGKA